MEKYIVVKNQRGDYAVQKTDTGLILCAGLPLEECKDKAGKWNLEELSIWTPLESE